MDWFDHLTPRESDEPSVVQKPHALNLGMNKYEVQKKSIISSSENSLKKTELKSFLQRDLEEIANNRAAQKLAENEHPFTLNPSKFLLKPRPTADEELEEYLGFQIGNQQSKVLLKCVLC